MINVLPVLAPALAILPRKQSAKTSTPNFLRILHSFVYFQGIQEAQSYLCDYELLQDIHTFIPPIRVIPKYKNSLSDDSKKKKSDRFPPNSKTHLFTSGENWQEWRAGRRTHVTTSPPDTRPALTLARAEAGRPVEVVGYAVISPH